MSWIVSRTVLVTWLWEVVTERGLRRKLINYPPCDVAALHPVPKHQIQLRLLQMIAGWFVCPDWNTCLSSTAPAEEPKNIS
jgi:hypothetical protein